MGPIRIPTAPLTRAAFAPFGDVVETEGAEHFRYNDGYAVRFHDLARIECAAEGGRPLLSIFRAKPFPLPLRIALTGLAVQAAGAVQIRLSLPVGTAVFAMESPPGAAAAAPAGPGCTTGSLGAR